MIYTLYVDGNGDVDVFLDHKLLFRYRGYGPFGSLNHAVDQMCAHGGRVVDVRRDETRTQRYHRYLVRTEAAEPMSA